MTAAIDLDSYLKRVGFTDERKPTLMTLRELHRLQPQAIAFENLSPLLGQPVALDAPSLHWKMVHEGRGGYCYEQNVLFASVLEALGFKLRWLTGWPRWQIAPGRLLPRSHLLLLVDLGGEEWLADVGFGGNTLTAPLRLASRDEQPTPHEPARIAAKGDALMVQVKIRDAWHDLVEFDLGQQTFAELEMGNWFTSTHPKSRFRNELLAARADVDRRYGLLDNVLTIHDCGGATERRRLTAASEIRDALTDLFRIRLPAVASLDDVLARFAGKSREAAE
jgi:N-hydroxyarylamine O-acetyltransferase